MLYTLLMVLLTIDSIFLIAAVLLQSGQGQGLAATFGGVSSSASSLFGTRQTGNLLTKASWWCGGIFLFLAFVLSLASTRGRAPRSVLDQAFPNAPAPAPVNAPANAGSKAPVVPLTPAPAPATPNQGTKAPAKKP
ncbi:MAG: preprotein translocase subunit SecG [Gemmatimonadetes bacterium]|jgi:preprotein translocase subunit SecG|nr:MAG: preprotein translocase subunit SecG [Gemmatimonadota bacterium]